MKPILSILFIAICAVPVAAQEAAQDIDEPRWSVRTTFGLTRIHKWGGNDEWFEVRVGRAIGSGLFSIDAGIAGSPAPFATVTSGFEIRPWRQKVVSPFFRAEAGVLGESDFGGVVFGVGAGMTLRLSRRFGMRMGAALNTHGKARGPVTSYGGLEYRW